MARELLAESEIADGLAALHPDWVSDGAALVRVIEFDAFLTAVGFIAALAPVAEDLDHHPDLQLSWRTVIVRLSTHSAGGLTELDLTLAGRLDALADDLQVPPAGIEPAANRLEGDCSIR